MVRTDRHQAGGQMASCSSCTSPSGWCLLLTDSRFCFTVWLSHSNFSPCWPLLLFSVSVLLLPPLNPSCASSVCAGNSPLLPSSSLNIPLLNCWSLFKSLLRSLIWPSNLLFHQGSLTFLCLAGLTSELSVMTTTPEYTKLLSVVGTSQY